MPTKVEKSTIYFPDRAPVQVSVKVELKASPEQVWKVLIDNPGWVKWYKGVSSCQTTSEKEGFGSTRRIVVDGLQVDEEIIGFQENKLWALSVYQTDKPVASCWVERLVLEKTEENGTIINYDAGLELLFIPSLIQCYIVSGIKKSWTRNLAAIDDYILDSKSP
eukprot:CAMPEP_0113614318 /NCGR_PEP_ID=MMETSP0017_2-20120614/7101_1 /TAXON_ID=2856 /ORGANISM="Cylindrotheca closterium" /LENGTH=163 /DNA_ID=CAMNT_0000523475 /DNA_START=43 /DNA_END=534 /DNA_ORIENTATION=+ /assembly_acc=CAM_ASM_000147